MKMFRETQIEKRIAALERGDEIASLRQRIEQIENKLANWDWRVESVERRLGEIEDRYSKLATRENERLTFIRSLMEQLK